MAGGIAQAPCRVCGTWWIVAHVGPCPVDYVCPPCRASLGYARNDAASYPAFADGPVADTPEPVTAEAVVSDAEPDGPDRDTVPHV